MQRADMDKDLAEEAGLTRVLADLDRVHAEAGEGGEVGAVFAGGGLGLVGSIAALYGLGTVGLSAVGITTGLAAAGAFLGGGMLAGIIVLGLPVFAFAFAGWAGAAALKKERVRRLQAEVLTRALLEQREVRARLEAQPPPDPDAAAALGAQDRVLDSIIRGLAGRAG